MEYRLQQNPITITNSNKVMIFLSLSYTMKFCLMHTAYLPPFFTNQLVCTLWKFFVISSCFRSTAFHQLAVLLLSGESKKFTVYYIIILYFSTVSITQTQSLILDT